MAREAPEDCVIHFKPGRALLLQRVLAGMLGFASSRQGNVVLSGFHLLRAWDLLGFLAEVFGAILQVSETHLSIREIGQRRLALVQAYPRRVREHVQLGFGLVGTGRRSVLVFAQIWVTA